VTGDSGGQRAVRVLVRGHVQGVGFRYFARDAARRVSLRGGVRHRRDGRAGEVQAAVGTGAGAQPRRVLRPGPPGASVTVVEGTPPEAGAGDFPAPFEIRPTA